MSAHATHEIHRNSIAASHAGERSGFFSEREIEVLAAYCRRGVPSTDREIQASCGYDVLAMVQPRISGLVEKGVLIEVGTKKCPTTGKRVRMLEIAPQPTMKQDSFI